MISTQSAIVAVGLFYATSDVASLFSSVGIKPVYGPVTRNPHVFRGLKQDLALTQALEARLCSSLIHALTSAWLPCQRETALEGFGPATECSAFGASYISSQLIGQK